jgi:hypothetical protein
MEVTARLGLGQSAFPMERPGGGGKADQGLYEITFREEFAKMNELTRSITLSSGVRARVSDKSLVDSLEGTIVWEYDSMACPQMIVQLYRGVMKIYTSQTNIYEETLLWWSKRTKIKLPDWR